MTSVSPVAEGGVDALPSIINGGGAETFTNSPPAATGAYKNCGYKMSDIPPPSVSAAPDKAEYKQPEFKQPAVISEEGARQALIKHCESQFCWGTGTANELKFSSVESSTSYNYTLHTFTESRATQWQTEPYKGQPIDGPENGIPLDPWSIPMNVCENFRPIEVRKVEVPHTATIQACHVCQGTGTMKCTGCDGNGGKLCNICRGQGRSRQRTKGTSGTISMVMSDCNGCNGTGKAPCVQCSGSGQMVCGTCHGSKQVKMFILLTVTWKTYTDTHIVGKANVPKALISKVKGTPVFEDIHPMLMPITVSPEPEIVSASARLIASHKYPNLRILMQKHTITTIPITQCECSQKGGQKMTYYVYGLDNKVHAPTYPDTFCWGCEIM